MNCLAVSSKQVKRFKGKLNLLRKTRWNLQRLCQCQGTKTMKTILKLAVDSENLGLCDFECPLLIAQTN